MSTPIVRSYIAGAITDLDEARSHLVAAVPAATWVAETSELHPSLVDVRTVADNIQQLKQVLRDVIEAIDHRGPPSPTDDERHISIPRHAKE